MIISIRKVPERSEYYREEISLTRLGESEDLIFNNRMVLIKHADVRSGRNQLIMVDYNRSPI